MIFSVNVNQICRKLQIWSHLLKKSLTENLTVCSVISSNGKIDRFLRLLLIFKNIWLYNYKLFHLVFFFVKLIYFQNFFQNITLHVVIQFGA